MTKGEIDRLGQRIGKSAMVLPEDLNKLQEYRQTFQEPISRVFNYVLSAARKIDKQCIVTYRIKRIDTIIEKLRRFANNPNGSMLFSRMWDIAGWQVHRSCLSQWRMALNCGHEDLLIKLDKPSSTAEYNIIGEKQVNETSCGSKAISNGLTTSLLTTHYQNKVYKSTSGAKAISNGWTTILLTTDYQIKSTSPQD